jgi:hypothetical protein
LPEKKRVRQRGREEGRDGGELKERRWREGETERGE